MRLDVPKKALLALAGTTSSSVGTWKLYDEVVPSVGTVLNKEGYHYSPIKAELKAEGVLDVTSATSGIAKLNFTQSPSVKRLLPSLEDISEETNDSSSSNLSLDENFYSDFEAQEGTFVAEIKHWPQEANQKNAGLIVKLELVIKNKTDNKAFMVQNTISNLICGLAFSNRYRFFLIEKESGTWKIKDAYVSPDSRIFPGSNQAGKYHFSGFPGLDLEIVEQNFCSKGSSPTNPCPDFKHKTATSYSHVALWKPDPSANQSLLEAIKVVSKGTDTELSDIWGNTEAPKGLNFDYVYKDKKWSNLTFVSGDNDKVKNLLTPLLSEKNKKGKWVPIEEFCNSWSRERKNADLRWQKFCYIK